MKFSVIIPVYNIEKYLKNCLDTILKQSFTDYEIILINDGSKDRSKEICEIYAAEHKNIILINKENGGPSSARRMGIKAASGDYVICIDGDDYVHNKLFENLNDRIETTPNVDMVCFGYIKDKGGALSEPILNGLPAGIYTDIAGIREKYLYDRTNENENTGCIIYSLWCKVIKKNIFMASQEAVPDEIKNGEDNLLTAYALSQVKKICVLDYAGYYYRENQNSITHIRKPIDLINITKVTEKMESICAYPEMNIAHNYLYSVYILTTDMARSSRTYKEFSELLGNLNISSRYYNIIPYGRKMKFRYRMKYILIQKKMWRILYMLSKVH